MESAAASEFGEEVLNFHERKEMTARAKTQELKESHSTMWQERQYRDCKGCCTANATVYGIGKCRQSGLYLYAEKYDKQRELTITCWEESREIWVLSDLPEDFLRQASAVS